MAKGRLAYEVTIDTAPFKAAIAEVEARIAQWAAHPLPAADEPIGTALLGAAAAAVLLPRPVSRRRLLFPWLRA